MLLGKCGAANPSLVTHGRKRHSATARGWLSCTSRALHKVLLKVEWVCGTQPGRSGTLLQVVPCTLLFSRHRQRGCSDAGPSASSNAFHSLQITCLTTLAQHLQSKRCPEVRSSPGSPIEGRMQSNTAAASVTALVVLAGLAIGKLWPATRRFGSNKQNLKVAIRTQAIPQTAIVATPCPHELKPVAFPRDSSRCSSGASSACVWYVCTAVAEADMLDCAASAAPWTEDCMSIASASTRFSCLQAWLLVINVEFKSVEDRDSFIEHFEPVAAHCAKVGQRLLDRVEYVCYAPSCNQLLEQRLGSDPRDSVEVPAHVLRHSSN